MGIEILDADHIYCEFQKLELLNEFLCDPICLNIILSEMNERLIELVSRDFFKKDYDRGFIESIIRIGNEELEEMLHNKSIKAVKDFYENYKNFKDTIVYFEKKYDQTK